MSEWLFADFHWLLVLLVAVAVGLWFGYLAGRSLR